MSNPDCIGLNGERELDACMLQCPMPLLKTRQALRQMEAGQVLLVRTRDAGAWHDIPAYLGQSPHKLVQRLQHDDEYRFWIEVGEQSDA